MDQKNDDQSGNHETWPKLSQLKSGCAKFEPKIDLEVALSYVTV